MKDQDKSVFISVDALKQNSVKQSSADSKNAIKQVINDYQDIVQIIAKSILKQKKIPQGICYDDLFSWGIEGLVKAYKLYKPVKNATFKTYASIRIKGEILDQIRKEWNYRSSGSSFVTEKERLEKKIDEFLDQTELKNASSLLDCSGMIYLLSIEEFNNNSNTIQIEDKNASIEEISEDNEQHSKLWEKIQNLTLEEKQIIQMFYVHNKTQTEISHHLKLSQSKVCRIHGKLLIKLKKALENDEFVY